MTRTPVLPAGLLSGPFTVDDAREAGLHRWHLEGASWIRLGPSTYVWTGLNADPMHGLRAAIRRLPARAFFSGPTAGWLHGIGPDQSSLIEATVPPGTGVSARAGIVLRRRALPEDEIVLVRGLRATSVAQTLADLSLRLGLTEAVVMADAAMHNRKIGLERLRRWVSDHAGVHGIRHLRRVLEEAEPASESPMESRLRMILVLGGLPRPKAQVSIHDRDGRFVGRPDLYYEAQRLGLEYDGAIHRDAMAQDNRRQNALLRAGVRLLRFTAGDVLNHPTSIERQVREMLEIAGSRGFGAACLPAFAGKTGESLAVSSERRLSATRTGPGAP